MTLRPPHTARSSSTCPPRYSSTDEEGVLFLLNHSERCNILSTYLLNPTEGCNIIDTYLLITIRAKATRKTQHPPKPHIKLKTKRKNSEPRKTTCKRIRT